MAMMRNPEAAKALKDGDGDPWKSSKEWDNDEYIDSLRRPKEELHQVPRVPSLCNRKGCGSSRAP